MITHKRHSFFFVLIIILFLCNSCSYNRRVELSPVEPYIFEENGIFFGGSAFQNNNICLNFDLPLLDNGKRRFGLEWNMYIKSDHNVDNIFLEGISLFVKELDITVSKQNLNHSLSSLPRIIDDKYYYFILVDEDDITIYIDEIKDAISEQLSILELYEKFKKVKTVTLTLEFKYTINGEEKNTTIIQNYNAKRITSNALWDAWMGI